MNLNQLCVRYIYCFIYIYIYFIYIYIFCVCIGSCWRSILCCQGSECNFQPVIGQQAKHIVVGRGMKLFSTQAFHKHLCAPAEERLYYLQKQRHHHHCEPFSACPATKVLHPFYLEMPFASHRLTKP